ncbi:IS3 family transposase [Mariniflexile sp.]|uniref:IS3 family transposase n=1 Tax=Mariniflexile sp. TaxID=1979402 RepID=UPI0035627152
MASYRHLYPIEKMCKVFKVSRSSFYRWYTAGPSKRRLELSLFTDLIKKEFDHSKKRYGSTRIAEKLKRKGYCISRCRVAKIMRMNNWASKHKRKFKATTDSNHSYPVCRNLLNRNFTPCRLNEAWVSDITYIQTNQGWLYLTTIIDLFDRQVIGWSLSTSLYTNQTIIPAWKMAVSKRTINMDLIFHSDRGIQYASKTFRTFIKSNPLVTQSMSRKGNCWDNAVAESFFKTLKVELIYNDDFKTIEQAKTAVFEYIEIWYNRKRLHSFLGYKTPYEVEQEFYQFKNVA